MAQAVIAASGNHLRGESSAEVYVDGLYLRVVVPSPSPSELYPPNI